MQDVRMAAIAANARPGDVDANLGTVSRWTREAAAAGAQVVVFPEAYLTGYDLDRVAEHALTLDDHALRQAASLAEELGVVISVGFLERDPAGFYVSQAWLGRDLRLVHRKCHRTGWERRHCLAGGTLAVQDLGLVKTGTLICYDSAFPAACETLVRRGAEVLVPPTCHGTSLAELRRHGVHLLRRPGRRDVPRRRRMVPGLGRLVRARRRSPRGGCRRSGGVGDRGSVGSPLRQGPGGCTRAFPYPW